MDEAFGRTGGRFKISLIDSTMMRIVHRAMNKAHERAQYKEGVIECLTEISKFYELAVMQLEGCLKFVQEETDSTFESSDEEVLGDLAEIRDRLVGRHKESELAIAEKDRELAWRLDNEMKLRKALEVKERQLDSLHANLKLEPTKINEGVEELLNHGNQVGIDEHVLENQVGAEEDRDEEFSGLKHSVEQQVWNIKQKLEPESKSERRRNKGCESLKIEQMCSDIDILRIEQMSSDIDILKETMDIAFGKMQSAIFLSEMEPVEQQWRLMIEKDTLAVLMKGFMGDIQENMKAQVRGRQKQVSCGLSKHLSDLMKEMKCLHDELEALCLSESNHESKNFLKPRGESPAEEDQYRKPKCYSSSVKEVDQEKQLGEKGSEDNDGNYVAKLIKNHESIIKRKNKELNWLKREISGGKGSSDAGREEDLVSSKRRIQDVIERMQNLVNWNAELGENYEDDEGDENVEGSSTKRLCNFTTTQQEGSLAEISEDGQEKVNKISISDVVSEELRKEIRMLKEEKEDASLQTMIMEQTYATIWEGCVYESSTELLRYDLEILITKGIHEDLLKKMVNEWNGQMGCYKMDAQIREEISYIVLSEAVKDFDSILDSILVECQDSRAESSCLVDYNLEGTLREDVTKVLLREICKEWNELVERSDAANLTLKKRYQIEFEETLREIRNTTNHKISKYKEVNLEGKLREEISRFLFGELYKEWYENIERSDTENLVREDIYNIAIQETFINIAHTGNSPESKLNEVNNSENGMEGFPFHNESFKLIEHSIKEDLLMVFLKEMSKEWKKETDAHNFESLIGEEIFLLALFGAIKEANTAYRETAAQDHFNISGEKFQRSQELNGEDVLINKEDSQMNCVEVQAGLIQSMSSESKEYSGQHDIIQLKHKKLDKLKISRELLTEMGSNFTCLSSKVEKALEQLTVSKEIVNELRCCLGAAGEDQKAFVDSAPNTRPSRLQQKEIKRVKLTPPYSAFTPFMEFLQIFMDFQCTVEEKLELNILRLEGAMQHLNPLAELVARRRRKERLYRKAFISRCENLRKAETEVDLLGNQVEVLLVLLEKIYTILHNCSPVLKNCSEVSDILKMIRKELDGELLGFTD